MKKFNKKVGRIAVLSMVIGLAGVLGLTKPIAVLAATTPNLGTAATYGVLTGTFNYNIGLTTITGVAGTAVLGVTGAFPGGGASLALTGTTETASPAYTQAGLDQNNALNNVVYGLNNQACTPIGAAVALNAYDVDGPGGLPPGTFPPGCYSTTGAMTITTGTTVTLDGSAGPGTTFIFRSSGGGSTLKPAANSTVLLTLGTSPCDVFWAPSAATTIGANSTFVGTVIDDAGITVGNSVTWTGRALAYAATLGTIAVDSDTINVPICAGVPPVGLSNRGTLTVIKTVINDNGGTKVVSDFPLFVNGSPVNSGDTNAFNASQQMYHVSETGNAQYVQSFSGDCDANGDVLLNRGDRMVCVVTNNDIGAPVVVPPVPPLIDVIKVPNPLALPAGPGSVTYTYTLKNIGTVPIGNITMVDDTCSAITLVSGDVNGDAKLDMTETWTYTCAANLAQTTTNTVVATGWANGISANDIAIATVVVGVPVVPPLIHVTKIPSPLALLAGGGKVTYTENITNPGTVALSNVTLTDDKCSPVKYISGDANGDAKLDPTETWTYTCTANLAKTTTNTATATGTANGMTVKDVAIATVIVAASAVPGLPKAGVGSMGNIFSLDAIVAGFGLAAFFILILAVRKKLLA